MPGLDRSLTHSIDHTLTRSITHSIDISLTRSIVLICICHCTDGVTHLEVPVSHDAQAVAPAAEMLRHGGDEGNGSREPGDPVVLCHLSGRIGQTAEGAELVLNRGLALLVAHHPARREQSKL